jgi:hypothetical protein
MAGILGITIGGLAAIAGQCQSPDTKPVASDEAPVAAEAPKPKAKPTPAPADLPALPEPVKVPAPAIPSAQPLLPTPVPVAKTSSESLPALPAPPMTIEKNVDLPQVLPAAAAAPPMVPPAPTEPSPKQTDPLVGAPMAVPPTPVARPTSPMPSSEFATPSSVPVFSTDLDVPARSSRKPDPTSVPVTPSPTVPANALHTSATVAPTAAVAVPTKFRIILRVGEGEPMFEVRHGDDLVMKVLCEKIDIKSPDKGQQGLSEVTATGKVRFVGFGAEGTCDTFSFLAGTGEVAMSGHVKVQVKDKIGRVESELIADQMRYKLDTSAMPGILKP